MNAITLCSIVAVIFMLMGIYCVKAESKNKALTITCVVIYTAAGIITMVLDFVLILSLAINAYNQKDLPIRYKMLTAYANSSENFIMDEDFIRNVLDYNEMIDRNRKFNDDPWLGFLEPLPYIGLERINLADYIK